MFKRLWTAIKAFFSAHAKLTDIYYCILPFGTFVAKIRSEHRIDKVFATMITMTDVQDDAFASLNRIGFRIDDKHRDFRCIVDRGKVVPYAIDKDTVELDASIWIDDKLRDCKTAFSIYELTDKLICMADFDQQRDVVLFRLEPIEQEIVKDMQRFLAINKVITLLELLLIAVIVLFITI